MIHPRLARPGQQPPGRVPIQGGLGEQAAPQGQEWACANRETTVFVLRGILLAAILREPKMHKMTKRTRTGKFCFFQQILDFLTSSRPIGPIKPPTHIIFKLVIRFRLFSLETHRKSKNLAHFQRGGLKPLWGHLKSGEVR